MKPAGPRTGPRALHRDPAALSLVFVGGALGTAARYGAETTWPAEGGWPWATFVVNLLGAFVLGLLLEALLRRGPDLGRRRRLRLLAGSGFCGAFTTYSAFALESVDLIRGGETATAAAYLVSTVILGVIAAFAGIVVGARISSRGVPR